MMRLTFVPQWGRGWGSYRVAGEILTINGEAWDFSAIPDGGEAVQAVAAGDDHIFVGPIRRIGGTIHATLIGWVGDDAARGQPGAPWMIEADGDIALPAVLVGEGQE